MLSRHLPEKFHENFRQESRIYLRVTNWCPAGYVAECCPLETANVCRWKVTQVSIRTKCNMLKMECQVSCALPFTSVQPQGIVLQPKAYCPNPGL